MFEKQSALREITESLHRVIGSTFYFAQKHFVGVLLEAEGKEDCDDFI